MSLELKRKEECCGCTACKNICPVSCINMEVDLEGFSYPQIDSEKCIQCNLCEKVCPIINSRAIDDLICNCNEKIDVYAAINLSDRVREESSSGGIFSLLADEILGRGGVVYGAAFDESGGVIHIFVTSTDDLNKLRGSKYLQSELNDCYKNIKKVLDDNIPVLFSGTPCQNDGLRCYLQREYENLYLVDFICHGVPAPMVWKRYLHSIEEKIGKNCRENTKITFRSKEHGWKRFSVVIPFENVNYIKDLNKDLYMRSYLRNISLRPSCYSCKSKPSYKISDITLADFWGIDKIDLEMYDDKGTSAVFANSDKGKTLFVAISDKIKYKKVRYEDVIKYNSAAYKSMEVPRTRKIFFDNLGRENILLLMKRLTKDSLYVQCRMKLISVIKYILRK